jgi:hypothetical protein
LPIWRKCADQTARQSNRNDMNLFVLIQVFEIATAIIAAIYFKKYSGSFLKYFLFMIWFIALVEILIGTLKDNGVIVQNNFIYNVITSLQYVYFFLLYYKSMKTQSYRKVVLGFLIVFVLSVIVNFLWLQPLNLTSAFSSYTFTIGAILLIVTIGLFLVEILNTEMVLYFKRYLMFWISMGLLVFYTGIIPFVLSLNLMPELLSTDSLAIIFFSLNLVMYACFTVGFILSHKYSG